MRNICRTYLELGRSLPLHSFPLRQTSSSLVIPKGEFLSNELKIEDPSEAPNEFHLQETLKALAEPSNMMGGGKWITFRNIDHFTLLTYNGKEDPIKSECADVKPVFSGKMNPPACA
ncbi:hypothetical protein LguiB_002632 [Lonicera macranthoides]